MPLNYYQHGRRDVPKMALTFDDGPNPPRTDEVLSTLARYGVRGTFFIIGRWADRYPRALDRIIQAGHCVGNHSYEHSMRVSDYDKAEATLGDYTGRRTIYVRPHSFDFGALSQSLVATLPTTQIIDSDVNPRDYALTDPREVARRVLEHPTLSGGSIVDLHDGSETEDTALRLSRPLPMIEALPLIIEGLQERGLEPVGLNELELVEPLTWTEGNDELMTVNPTAHGVVVRYAAE